MAWVKVDDGFPDHPKVLVLTLAAQGLWLAGLCYANRHRTDGQLPSAFLRRVGDEAAWAAAEELVAVGLWHETATGWEIHDYADYQSTKDQIEAVAAKRAAAGKRGGQANAKQTRSNLLDGCLPVASTRRSKTEAEEEVEEEVEEEPALRAGSARARSASHDAPKKKRTPATTKLTAEFEPSASTLAWAREHGWHAEAFQREFEKFVGYHLAKGGRMASWDQALVNWLRKAEEFAAQKVVPIRSNGAARPTYEDFTAVLDDIIAGGAT